MSDPLAPMLSYEQVYEPESRNGDTRRIANEPDEAPVHALADEAPVHALADECQVREESEPEPPPVLPDEFWSAREVHGHIRSAARARGAGPDAVLLTVLCHLGLQVPAQVNLPPLVGGPGSLNLVAALIGPSGAGKGAAMRAGEDLLPAPPSGVGVGPLGTGAGMVDVYFSRRSGEPERTKAGWLFIADEGQILTKLSEGQGSVTLEYIRQGWSGERIGAQTVSAPWRVLPAGQYRLLVLLGLQPAIARPLLADVAGGTPQRFVYAGVSDPGASLERPEDPGGIAWECPAPPRPIDVAQPVRDEITVRRHGVLTEQRVPDTYDSHRDQNRLKVAALLALLEQRMHVTVADWDLAELVMANSDAVRARTIAAQRAADAAVEAGRNVRAAGRARAEESARRRVNDTVARVARVLARAVTQAGPIGHGQLRARVASRDREWFDDAVEHALAIGWVTEDDHGKYVQATGETPSVSNVSNMSNAGQAGQSVGQTLDMSNVGASHARTSSTQSGRASGGVCAGGCGRTAAPGGKFCRPCDERRVARLDGRRRR